MADDPADTPTEPVKEGPGKNAVPFLWIVVLAFYLVALTGLFLWGIYTRWPTCSVVCLAPSASPSPTPTPPPSTQPSPTPAATPATPAGTPTPTPTATQPPATGTQPPPTTTATPPPVTVTIESVSPKAGLVNCTIQVTIKGRGFKKDASALFGGLPATVVSVDPNGQFITVQPPSHAEGDVDVVVKNADGATSDIAKAAFNYSCPPAPEGDLFLLIVFAGALGGTLHGLRSLYWYVGLRSLLRSWTLMYVLLPFTGASIAVVFYAIIRAGLIPVQSSKNASLGMIAMALLVGLFSQQAAVKLKDIFDAFFAKPAQGPPAESKPQPSVPPGGSAPATKPGVGPATPTFDKPQGKAGDQVKITGTNMTRVDSITFGAVAEKGPFPVAGNAITITVPEQPTQLADPNVDVVIKGDAATETLRFTYEQ